MVFGDEKSNSVGNCENEGISNICSGEIIQ